MQAALSLLIFFFIDNQTVRLRILPTVKVKRSNILMNIFVSSFNFVKRSIGLDHMGGIVGNAALVAISMISLLHLHQVVNHEQPCKLGDRVHSKRTVRRTKLVGSSTKVETKFVVTCAKTVEHRSSRFLLPLEVLKVALQLGLFPFEKLQYIYRTCLLIPCWGADAWNILWFAGNQHEILLSARECHLW